MARSRMCRRSVRTKTGQRVVCVHGSVGSGIKFERKARCLDEVMIDQTSRDSSRDEKGNEIKIWPGQIPNLGSPDAAAREEWRSN